jgi:hypothetical protein
MIEMKHPNLLEEIYSKKDLSDDLQQKLHSVSKDFAMKFKVSGKV